MKLALRREDTPNARQMKFLQAQLKKARRLMPGWDEPKLKEPSAVKAARKTVRRWDHKVRVLQERAQSKHSRRVAVLERQILFADTKSALQAVESFLRDECRKDR